MKNKIKVLLVVLIVAPLTLLMALNTELVEGFILCIVGGSFIIACKEVIIKEDTKDSDTYYKDQDKKGSN